MPQSNILTTAKIGFEFTFACGAGVDNNWTDLIEQDKGNGSYINYYDSFVDRFCSMMYPSNGCEIIKKGKFGEDICKLKFGLGDGSEFWITTSVDPKVIEIQTMPVTYNQIIIGSNVDGSNNMGLVGNILNDLFTVIANMDYVIGDGGGHINVDYATGFGNNFELVVKTLIATEGKLDMARKSNLSPIYYDLMDWGNEGKDPFISTGRVVVSPDFKEKWKSFPGQNSAKDLRAKWFDYVKKDIKKPNDFRVKHADWLFRYPTYTQSEYDKSKQFGPNYNPEILDTVLHYQAVSIEHIFDRVPDNRRLEFRFFKAQNDVNDIKNGIEFINDIVTRALELKLS